MLIFLPVETCRKSLSFLYFFAMPMKQLGPLVFMLIAVSYLITLVKLLHCITQNKNVGTCHCNNYNTKLSSNVTLAGEFTIASTLFTITSDKSSSTPKIGFTNIVCNRN